jgi:hypothetical protein
MGPTKIGLLAIRQGRRAEKERERPIRERGEE